jgi:hypothetical protein
MVIQIKLEIVGLSAIMADCSDIAVDPEQFVGMLCKLPFARNILTLAADCGEDLDSVKSCIAFILSPQKMDIHAARLKLKEGKRVIVEIDELPPRLDGRRYIVKINFGTYYADQVEVAESVRSICHARSKISFYWKSWRTLLSSKKRFISKQ